MNKKKYTKAKPNKSKLALNENVVKALNKVFAGGEGSVSYYFTEKRIKFDEENPKGKEYSVKSILHTKLSPRIFEEEHRGKIVKRSHQEVLRILEGTKHDLGATYFIIS